MDKYLSTKFGNPFGGFWENEFYGQTTDVCMMTVAVLGSTTKQS